MGDDYRREKEFKAQKALNSIHDAREQADTAMDQLIHRHTSNAPDDEFADAHTDLHIAVMALYNRMRPFLKHVPELWKREPLMYERDENGEIKTQTVQTEDGPEEVPEGIFGLKSLDRWRLASTIVEERREKVGQRAESTQKEQPLKMPLELAVAAYDALEMALVELGFSAEPGSDVPMTNLDDAPTPGAEGGETARTDGGQDE